MLPSDATLLHPGQKWMLMLFFWGGGGLRINKLIYLRFCLMQPQIFKTQISDFSTYISLSRRLCDILVLLQKLCGRYGGSYKRPNTQRPQSAICLARCTTIPHIRRASQQAATILHDHVAISCDKITQTSFQSLGTSGI